MIKKRFRYAFSMVELIFVVVVLGIVASIGSSIIVQAFQTYITQKATSSASIKTELAAEQIANRLSYAIPWTLVAKNPANPFNDSTSFVDNPTVVNANRTALEWIGVDGDSFEATATPGWSGYCDTESFAEDVLVDAEGDTPGSDIAMTQTIINNLSNSGVDFTTTTFAANKPLIVFKTDNYRDGTNELPYKPNCIGLVAGTTDCAIRAYGTAGGASHPQLTLDKVEKIAEHYVLAWSAYALVPANARAVNGQTVYDLVLYYNYQPWEGEKYSDVGVSSQILVNNVSLFDFTNYKNSIRFKICVLQPIGTNTTEMVTLCKEKVVMR